jgi:hypothetical protein
MPSGRGHEGSGLGAGGAPTSGWQWLGPFFFFLRNGPSQKHMANPLEVEVLMGKSLVVMDFF